MSKALQTMEWMTPGANLNAYIQGTATVPILSIDEDSLYTLLDLTMVMDCLWLTSSKKAMLV